jgi:hypothetical protein
MTGSQGIPAGQAGYPAIPPSKGMASRATIHPRDGIIPGTGQVKDEMCGQVRSIAVCSADPSHDRRKIKHSCNRLECPECFPRVLHRNSEALASRVQGYRLALAQGQTTLEGQYRAKPRAPRQGVLSPPQKVINAVYDRSRKALDKLGEPYTSQDLQAVYLEKFRYETYKALDTLGVDGAGVVIHFYRVTDEGKALHKISGTELPRWAWLQKQDDWQSLVYFSPHVHLMFYGMAIDTDKFYDESDGWTFKNKGDIYDAEGFAYYILSHAPVIKDRLSVTYWGCLSPRKLKAVDTFIQKDEVLCEKCGAVLVFASLDENGEIQNITDRPLYHKKRIRIYALAAAPPDEQIKEKVEK